jgi:signal transduction histidine kinase
MNIIFSKRLASPTAIVIYLALIGGFSPSVIRHHQIDGSDRGTALMAIAIILYTGLTTLGWRWCLRQASSGAVYGYFLLASLMGSAMFWLENMDTHTGAGVGNLFVVFLLQSGVLPLRRQFAVHAICILAMTAITAINVPLGQMLLMPILVFITNGAIALIGRLIVRDEQTQIALEAAHQQLRAYALQTEELATMRERNRLAREIHDTLGHYLTVVNTQIEAARTVMLTDVERSDYLLGRAQTLTKDGLSEIRRSIAALRASPIERLSLSEALLSLVDEHRESGLTIHYDVEGEARVCSTPVEQALYRAAQEAMTNVRKHAQATTVELHLLYSHDCIRLTVCDNGQGSTQSQPGFGLLGLQERVKLLGGLVKAETKEQTGFILSVEVPA